MVDYDLSDGALVGLVTLALEGAQGLRPAQSGDSLSVDNACVDRGHPIPELAKNAQRTAAEALGASTGLGVRTAVAVEYREGGGAA